jgi:hypothetical protein
MDELAKDIERLPESAVGRVFQILLTQFDDHPDVAVDQHEVEERLSEDYAFVGRLSETLGIGTKTASASVRANDVLLALMHGVPEVREPVAEAVAQVEHRSTLPVDPISISLVVLAVATSAAILRPRVLLRRSKDGDRERSEFRFEVLGVQNIEGVVRALLSFIRLHGGDPGSQQ